MTYRDEFDEPQGGGSFLSRVGPKAAFLIVFIALFFMIGVVLKLYVGAGDDAGQSVPIVRADDNPFKTTPDDPGGMEIPHKDSTIFSSLKASRDEDSKVENLLADDENEDPMPRSQLFAGLNTEANPDLNAKAEPSPLDQPIANTKPQTNAEEAPKVKAEPEPTPVVKAESKPIELAPDVVIIDPVPEKVVVLDPIKPVVTPDPIIVKIEPAPLPKPEPVPKPVKVAPKPAPVETTPTPAPSVSSSGDYYVQVGSVKSSDGAEGEWKKIVAKHSALSGYSHRVEKADLGPKGVFYRILAGPVSKDQATATCNKIKAKSPGGCLVKKK